MAVGVRPRRTVRDRRSPTGIRGRGRDELVRAAAFYLDGTGYQGEGPKGGFAHVPGGFFNYLIVPRHERLYIMQVTFL
ncbi:hypothetical protein [Streptomyces himalayensis]|uniref:hypothetical protein n=1 Tax=Streptomyces himalayensis TaxID=2820085 RepID=UPI00286839EB|nr:hypothetical protein [Streptomyces himalayensis]